MGAKRGNKMHLGHTYNQVWWYHCSFLRGRIWICLCSASEGFGIFTAAAPVFIIFIRPERSTDNRYKMDNLYSELLHLNELSWQTAKPTDRKMKLLWGLSIFLFSIELRTNITAHISCGGQKCIFPQERAAHLRLWDKHNSKWAFKGTVLKEKPKAYRLNVSLYSVPLGSSEQSYSSN